MMNNPDLLRNDPEAFKNNPDALRNSADDYNRQQRLRTILERWKANPGSAPNGTGPTGFRANDARAWAQNQEDTIWATGEMHGRPATVQGDYSHTEFANRPSLAPLTDAARQNRANTINAFDANSHASSYQDRRRPR